MEAPHKTPRRNGGRIALIVVLALSLLLNALALGAVIKLRQSRLSLLGPVAEAPRFPRPLRRELGAALSDNRDALRPQLRALAAARAQMVETGTARPFDRAAADAAMKDFRTQADALMTGMQAILLDALEDHAAE